MCHGQAKEAGAGIAAHLISSLTIDIPLLHTREIRAEKHVPHYNFIESHQVDGNDVLAVFEVSQEAVDRCRRGEGPVFIEFQTYRLRGHVGPDDNIQGVHTDIRPKEEEGGGGEKWRQFKSAPSIAPLALSLALERKVTETVGDFLETEGHSEGTGGRFLGRINRGDDG